MRLHVDPLEGFQPWQARRLIYGAGVEDPDEQKQIAAIVGKLYDAFVGCDAMLCEINPLIVTPDGEVKALDSKFTVDDNALYRHPDIAEMRDLEASPARGALRAREGRHLREARRRGRASSATAPGSSMSTLDVVALVGGRPANFCDLGGGGDAQGVVDALEVITARPAGEVDPLQHLRRDHALRRGRARDPRRRSTQMTIEHADRRPARRHERGGGAEAARRGRAAEPPRRADDARRARRAVELAADDAIVWTRARAGVPRARRASRGRGPRPDRRVGRGRADRARRRHRRRPRRAAAARGRPQGRHRRPGARDAARRHLPRARTSRSPTARFDVVVCADRARTTSTTSRAAVARDGARRARPRRRRGHALRRRGGRGGRAAARPDARALLLGGGVARASSRTAGLEVEEVEAFEKRDRARAVARARRLRRRGRGRACASCSPTGSRTASHARPKLVLKARKRRWRSSSTATRSSSSRA